MMTQEALQKLIDTLALDPENGNLIKDTGRIRKIRWETGKEAKRGGLRLLIILMEKNLIIDWAV